MILVWVVAGLASLPTFPHPHHQGLLSNTSTARSPSAAGKKGRASSPVLMTSVFLTCTHTTRDRSDVLPRWGSGTCSPDGCTWWETRLALPFVLMLSGPTLMPSAVGKGGIFAPPLPSYGIYKGEGKWHCPAPKSTGSPAPPTTGSALACCLGEMQCWFCYSHDPRASSPTNHREWGVGEGGGLLSFTHSTLWQMRGAARSPTHIFRGRSLVPWSTESTLPCCPGDVAGPTLQSAAVSEGQDQLSTLVTPGPAFPTWLRWGGMRVRGKGVVSS